jgi:hypothetical protein
VPGWSGDRQPAFGSLPIIYDEPSSPSADDYLIDADRSTLRLSTGYPIEPTFKKKSSPGQIRRRRTQIDLKLQSRRKKSSLTTKSVLANRMIVV